MKLLDKTKAWHQSKTGLMAFGLAELALAYAFVSWAIDSGRLLAWFLSVILTGGALQNFVKLMWNAVHGNKAAKA
jgi:hypothetical protein